MIVIVDYSTGNISSIKNLIRKIGFDAVITNDPGKIRLASKLILPGVGHFDYGMQNLKEFDLIAVLNRKVIEDKTPVLGICLGAQLLTKGSDEGIEPGLGWIDGYTRAFDKTKLPHNIKVPHMGWSDVQFRADAKIGVGFIETPRFYFVHSYRLVCNSESDVLGTSIHGHEFVSVLGRENILGVQFHPEKSHKFGAALLTNFIRNY